MKRAFAILLTISISVIAVFGAFAMQHASEYGHVGCLAAAAPAPACPVGDVVTIFLFHVEILKGLSLAIASGYMALTILSLLFIIAFVLARERARPLLARQCAVPLFLDKIFLSAAPFMRWLALHENSPSFA